jgi:hypothetical protein
MNTEINENLPVALELNQPQVEITIVHGERIDNIPDTCPPIPCEIISILIVTIIFACLAYTYISLRRK